MGKDLKTDSDTNQTFPADDSEFKRWVLDKN